MRRILGVAALAAGVLSFSNAALAEPQPHMQAALQDLQNALQEIAVADQYNDHGGHAGRATQLIQQAIHEVHEGIRYRDEHGS